MDAKLKVVGGGKAGLEIPLRKASFVIGRAPECSLRAGSDAISRRHCEIKLTRAEISIVDLGSRNGTLVNGKKIDGPVVLKPGDEIAVGPLKFQVILQHGLNTEKHPHVKSIADAAARSAEQAKSERAGYEDDITKWLTDPPDSESRVFNETMSIRLDETNAASESSVLADESDAETAEKASPEESDSKSKPHIGKKKGKPKPGKLPEVTKPAGAKDSREAAAEVLRAMTRRR